MVRENSLLLLCFGLAALLTGCEKDQSQLNFTPQLPGANPVRGATLIASYGCGSCHVVPGVKNAEGEVGPPLSKFAQRVYVAGMLRNTPDNLANWIENPQSVVAGNAMPNMGVSDRDAQDIAAYLYTLQ